MEKDNKSEAAARLREKAEEIFKKKPVKSVLPLSEVDILRLIQEFEVHQIELELENEELKLAKTTAQDAIELYDFALAGYFTLSKEGEIIQLNLSGAKMLGKEQLHLICSRFGFFVSEDTLPVFNDFLEKVFENRIKESCDVTLSINRSTPIHVHLTGIIAENKEQCLVAAIDITERKQAEEALRERVKELACLHAINELIEKEDNIEKILQGTADLIPNYWLHSEIACARIIFEGRQYQSGNFRETEGRLSAKLKSDGKPVGVIDLCYLEERPIRDEGPFLKEERNLINAIAEKLIVVTEWKQADEALQENEAKYRALIETTGTGYLILDWECRVIDANREYVRLSGYSELREILGRSIVEWTAEYEKQKNAEAVAKCIKKGFIRDLVIDYVDNTGRITPVEISATFEGKGEKARIISICRDITERKQAEEALKEALVKAEESDRLKTAFINNISHEVRTPLNGILGFGQLMAEPDISAEDKASYLEVLNKSGYRLINTITNIMDISLIVSGGMGVHKKTYNVKQLLEEIRLRFEKQCTEKNLSLSLHTPEETDNIEIYTDAELLGKILSHLLDNAVKFTDSGGISFGCTIDSNLFRFFVKDTGVGINPTAHNRIFDNFIQENISNTRGHEGSGLGLSIARGLMELLGGEIGLESVKGKGSTFFFTIPAGGTVLSDSSVK